MTNPRHLCLGLLTHPTGNHVASWMHPKAQIDAGSNFSHYVELAQIAERGNFDFLFLADSLAVRGGDLEPLSRWPQYMAYFEPTTLLSAIAAVTTRLGLVATATTSYNEPYNIARRYASLDHISNGRAGWNIVTSSNPDEARNFGREDHFGHEDRYARAREFHDVVCKLWDSWEDDAFVRDRSTSRYFDPKKLHVADHQGEYFKVRGPLNISRPPQGRPVIAQAGSSETGRDFAGYCAEIIFAPLHSLDAARKFSTSIAERARAHGRSRDDIRITPGLNVIVAETLSEAQAKKAYLENLVHPTVGLALLSTALGGVDLSACPIDEPLALERIPNTTNASQGTLAHLVEMSQREQKTVRDLYLEYAGARGQRTIVGTAETIADEMQEWFEDGSVDGFLFQPSVAPVDLQDFVDMVIPELKRRGLLNTSTVETTLRQRLGLHRPNSMYVK